MEKWIEVTLKKVQQYCWWCRSNTKVKRYKKSKNNGRIFKSVKKIITKPTDKQPDTVDMPELESEKSAKQEKKQRRQGLKILTPNQMFSRLQITLA